MPLASLTVRFLAASVFVAPASFVEDLVVHVLALLKAGEIARNVIEF